MAQSEEPPENKRRSSIWTLVGLGLVVVALVVVVTRFVGQNSPLAEQCTATTSDGQYVLAPNQMADASTITAVGMARHLPERAIVIALATSLQESKLVNLPGGDQDSVGLFQQRHSEGWGTVDDEMNPAKSAGMFYDHLTKLYGTTPAGYNSVQVGTAAQDVQHSADSSGASYESHTPEATVLAAALSGVVPAATTCQFSPDPASTQQPGSDGFTPRADTVQKSFNDQFCVSQTSAAQTSAAQTSAGSVPSFCQQPTVTDGGRGLSLNFPVADGNENARGWAVATWAVSQAASSGIATVSYDGQTWSAANGSAGWQQATPSGSGTSTVSIDVEP